MSASQQNSMPELLSALVNKCQGLRLGYSGCAGCAHHRPKGHFVKEYSHVESNLYFRTD